VTDVKPSGKHCRGPRCRGHWWRSTYEAAHWSRCRDGRPELLTRLLGTKPGHRDCSGTVPQSPMLLPDHRYSRTKPARCLRMLPWPCSMPGGSLSS